MDTKLRLAKQFTPIPARSFSGRNTPAVECKLLIMPLIEFIKQQQCSVLPKKKRAHTPCSKCKYPDSDV
jgi:hypothetical protein